MGIIWARCACRLPPLFPFDAFIWGLHVILPLEATLVVGHFDSASCLQVISRIRYWNRFCVTPLEHSDLMLVLFTWYSSWFQQSSKTASRRQGLKASIYSLKLFSLFRTQNAFISRFITELCFSFNLNPNPKFKSDQSKNFRPTSINENKMNQKKKKKRDQINDFELESNHIWNIFPLNMNEIRWPFFLFWKMCA